MEQIWLAPSKSSLRAHNTKFVGHNTWSSLQNMAPFGGPYSSGSPSYLGCPKGTILRTGQDANSPANRDMETS